MESGKEGKMNTGDKRLPRAAAPYRAELVEAFDRRNAEITRLRTACQDALEAVHEAISDVVEGRSPSTLVRAEKTLREALRR